MFTSVVCPVRFKLTFELGQTFKLAVEIVPGVGVPEQLTAAAMLIE